MDPRSEIWDPGLGMGKNQDLGSGINICNTARNFGGFLKKILGS
jgi:hypothetical protein